ncbi:deoxyribose-phosphate aldolase [Acholeplasma laidlawii]|uniref:deoxyribose-phosphate aldolase n=1 Tax=Acholeplasma laidlawii TaxID=2148 RepID=UPI0018C2DDD5|nr:deoxyribose-phosphate aldolase [Acholeplasma laidlawii]MBG0762087.1 deoxyribose-phosphate aldolase [Acholeplasma laidlawii]
MKLNTYIDHTKLGPIVTLSDIDTLIDEAIENQFKSVCVSPIWVAHAKSRLEGTGVLVCTVVGFPFGTHLPKVKAFETKEAIKQGADEIDMVVDVDAVRSKDRSRVSKDIKAVVKAAQGRTVKVIIETAYLDKKQITFVSKIAVKAGATFVKTSTGYASRGASVEDIVMIKKAVGDDALIKASGGIRSKEDALLMIEKGANRLGTSSGVKLIKGETSDGNTTY